MFQFRSRIYTGPALEWFLYCGFIRYGPQHDTSISSYVNSDIISFLIHSKDLQYPIFITDGCQRKIPYKDMMTSSNGNIFRVTGPLCGEFTGPGEFPTQRPVTRSFDVFPDMRLNKRLSKQWWGWWFETPSWSLWRQCNDIAKHIVAYCWHMAT